MTTIRIQASTYENEDDGLAAAAADVALERGLEGWDLGSRWEDDRVRDVILLDVPAHAVRPSDDDLENGKASQ